MQCWCSHNIDFKAANHTSWRSTQSVTPYMRGTGQRSLHWDGTLTYTACQCRASIVRHVVVMCSRWLALWRFAVLRGGRTFRTTVLLRARHPRPSHGTPQRQSEKAAM